MITITTARAARVAHPSVQPTRVPMVGPLSAIAIAIAAYGGYRIYGFIYTLWIYAFRINDEVMGGRSTSACQIKSTALQWHDYEWRRLLRTLGVDARPAKWQRIAGRRTGNCTNSSYTPRRGQCALSALIRSGRRSFESRRVETRQR